MLFNLRSALDNLVCGLARTANQSADCDKLEFPICTTPELFDAAVTRRKCLAGVADGAIKRIREMQPFHAPANTIAIHPLWLLHELNNLDKHQSVHISIAATHSGQVVVFNQRNEAIHAVELPTTMCSTR